MDTLKGVTVRFADILYRRVVADVEKRKQENRKFSISDWLIEAAREKLDGPPEPAGTMAIHRNVFTAPAPRRSAAELAASIPGVRLGIPEPPEEVVELDGEPDWEAECRREFTPKVLAEAARSLRWWNKADWKKRLEGLREMRERAAET